MNNITKILFHDISWFFDDTQQDELNDFCKEEIKDFINKGCKEGQFEVILDNNEVDYLTWKIVF